MARKIPPRRVPRDRVQQKAVSSGSIFGGSSIPGAHTHLEADITDLGPYLLLTGGTLTGNLTLDLASPTLSFQQGSITRIQIKLLGVGTDGGHMRLFSKADSGALKEALRLTSNNIVACFEGARLQVQDATGADSGLWSHDGTDFNLALTNTADYNITGLTALNVSGLLNINIGSDALTTLAIGEPSVTRGNSQDGRIILYGETASAIKSFTIVNTGANLQITGASGTLQVPIGVDLTGGSTLRVRDTGNTDSGRWTHDGIDFNLVLTNTTDYNITGADVKFGGAVGFNAAAPLAKPTVSGSRSSNAALASLLTALAAYGLITDSSS